ncbi:MAG: sn-glycerol-3-phosphate ABC transporter ATP-binding protein UgpC [Betaproteobacteria bacterium AqS2]|uniref:Sn-glycerol-3-phosphate ABC transporter ATP-binding protein UgpC n=1 Tax=Candidatus Amphirhobacter heronislandensis TaxID=1732024 RepID=A0A930XX17_9GAMM|nr:sn-glycerol-3-phosphate ABC transporter ATP-binding protein UgpC [Betaproteobacteria bacterium AqS2]
MADLRLRGIAKSFGATEVLRDVELEVADGEFVVLVGPSGCGKSTLLRIVAGLEKQSAGDIEIGGANVNAVPAADRGLAMVFQSYALYPHMTVYKNMAFALENTRMPKEQITARVREAAAMLRLGELLERKPAQLSGGQRQRVAIGRAMVREPKVFLFDEPLSNLDAELRVAMRKELATLHASIKATMVFVTHDQTEAMTLADRIVVMRAGVLEQIGRPLDVYNHPANLFVAGFIGSPRMNFFAAAAEGGRLRLAAGGMMDAPPGIALADGAKVTVGVRPEHVAIGTAAGCDPFAGAVEINEQLGGESYLYCGCGLEEQVVVHSPGQNELRVGDRIELALPPGRAHVFDGDGKVVRPA